MVDAWVVPVTKLFTGQKMFGGHLKMLLADHYNKNLPETINQLVGVIRCFVQFRGAGELQSREERGTIEEKEMFQSLIESGSYIHHQCTTLRLHVFCRKEQQGQFDLFAQNSELCMNATLQRLPLSSERFSPLHLMYD